MEKLEFTSKEGGGGVTDASLFCGRGCEKLTLNFPEINERVL